MFVIWNITDADLYELSNLALWHTQENPIVVKSSNRSMPVHESHIIPKCLSPLKKNEVSYQITIICLCHDSFIHAFAFQNKQLQKTHKPQGSEKRCYDYKLYLWELKGLTALMKLFMFCNFFLWAFHFNHLINKLIVRQNSLLAFSLSRAICCLRYSITWSASAPFCSSLFSTALLAAIFIKKRAKNLDK